MEMLLLYLPIGAFAGLMAGLLGVGGGLIIVPALVFAFRADNIAEPIVMHLAIGTSLATIILTSLSSMRAHHRRGAVRWDVFLGLTPGILGGTLIGAAIADQLSGRALWAVFGVFELIVGVQMAIGWQASAQRDLPKVAGTGVVGVIIGFVSAIVGIGGATLTVPYLVWRNVNVRQAVATSAAVGLPVAVGGTVGFLVLGWNKPLLPPLSSGYIYLPALLGIGIASLLFAPLGARLTHTLNAATLRRIFSLFIVVVGGKMLITAW